MVTITADAAGALAPAATSSARVDSQWFAELPEDLYIPPEAFAVLLERFEGPLDFLLYLVRKNGFDLRHLDIAPIASQYISYIQLMHTLDVELAADYLVMAALLADIKSRLLLPKPSKPQLEDDPRADLMARLETYASLKHVAQQLGAQPVLERDVYLAYVDWPERPPCHDIGFAAADLQHAMRALLGRPSPTIHALQHEAVQLSERLHSIQAQLRQAPRPCRFDQLLHPQQGRMGIVVSLIAVLELVRQGLACIVHDGTQQPLTVWSTAHGH